MGAIKKVAATLCKEILRGSLQALAARNPISHPLAVMQTPALRCTEKDFDDYL